MLLQYLIHIYLSCEIFRFLRGGFRYGVFGYLRNDFEMYLGIRTNVLIVTPLGISTMD